MNIISVLVSMPLVIYIQLTVNLAFVIGIFIVADFIDESYKSAMAASRPYSGGQRWIRQFKKMMVVSTFGLGSVALWIFEVTNGYFEPNVYRSGIEIIDAFWVMSSVASAVFGLLVTLYGCMYIRGFWQYKQEQVVEA